MLDKCMISLILEGRSCVIYQENVHVDLMLIRGVFTKQNFGHKYDLEFEQSMIINLT